MVLVLTIEDVNHRQKQVNTAKVGTKITHQKLLRTLGRHHLVQMEHTTIVEIQVVSNLEYGVL